MSDSEIPFPVPRSSHPVPPCPVGLSGNADDNDEVVSFPEIRRSRKRTFDNNPGFDFVDELPEHLLCSICQSVFTKPVIVNGCGHEFCEPCLDRSAAIKRECPLCRNPFSGSNYSTHLRRVEEEVNQLRTRCSFSSAGCDVVLPLAELKRHLEVCVYADVSCHHSEYGCEWSGTRQGLSQHLESCHFDKMKGFLEKSKNETTQLKLKCAALQEEVKRFKFIENVVKLRSERLRQCQRHKLGVILTCDGPLKFGGTVIERHQTLFELGIAQTDHAFQLSTMLYAEEI
eukprot:c11748_g1_i2.p1 GENE.c11748_g1_i2~~c11748_g1_i2.p1  ORF type:complete len:286 (+),score=26.74 c11748_g1_i2:40-897(+)